MSKNKISHIPSTWETTVLGDVIEDLTPGFPCGDHNQEGRGTPHLRPMNISKKGNIHLEKVKYVEEDEEETLKEGDVLFNNTNSPKLLGKTAYISTNKDWYFSNHMTRIRVKQDLVSPKWLANYLNSLLARGFYRRHCRNHVNQASINQSFLRENISIPLPRLAEQQRIVAKIEELFSKLDSGVSELKITQKQLEQYRKSVFKWGVEGKLTKEWREESTCSTNGTDLVEKISQKKLELYNDGTIRKPKTLPEISPNNLPIRLPDGWTWERLGNLFLMINGDRSSNYPSREDQVSKGIPFFSTTNIQNGSINLREKQLKFITEEKFESLRRGKARDGDVLMALRGSVGKFGVFRKNDDFDTGFINAQLIILRPLCGLRSSYLKTVFNSPVFKQQLHRASSGSAQPQISATALSQILVPIPPVNEQIQISLYIEKSLSITEKLKDILDIELTRAERLRQSTLKCAFEGKLVPRDLIEKPQTTDGGDTNLEPREQATLSEVTSDVE